jgi:hypothetical protein
MNDLPEVKLLPADGREVSGDTKFGGKPQFIQSHNTPECCCQPMALLVQVDGLDFPEAGLPDSSLAYLYVCRQCFQVSSDLQSM